MVPEHFVNLILDSWLHSIVAVNDRAHGPGVCDNVPGVVAPPARETATPKLRPLVALLTDLGSLRAASRAFRSVVDSHPLWTRGLLPILFPNNHHANNPAPATTTAASASDEATTTIKASKPCVTTSNDHRAVFAAHWDRTVRLSILESLLLTTAAHLALHQPHSSQRLPHSSRAISSLMDWERSTRVRLPATLRHLFTIENIARLVYSSTGVSLVTPPLTARNRNRRVMFPVPMSLPTSPTTATSGATGTVVVKTRGCIALLFAVRDSAAGIEQYLAVFDPKDPAPDPPVISGTLVFPDSQNELDEHFDVSGLSSVSADDGGSEAPRFNDLMVPLEVENVAASVSTFLVDVVEEARRDSVMM